MPRRWLAAPVSLLVSALALACASTGPVETGAESCICREGKAQSPIDLLPAKPAELPVLELPYGPATARLKANADVGFKVSLDPPPVLTIGGEEFTFDELHFHYPREHELAGTPAAMELHLVHKNAVGEAAVVGVFLRPGTTNAAVARIWERWGSSDPFPLDPAPLLPSGRAYLRYAGSLTTPPCTEGIRWHVFTEPVPIGPEQVEAYRSRFGRTVRDPQDRNGRTVLRDGG